MKLPNANCKHLKHLNNEPHYNSKQIVKCLRMVNVAIHECCYKLLNMNKVYIRTLLRVKNCVRLRPFWEIWPHDYYDIAKY